MLIHLRTLHPQMLASPDEEGRKRQNHHTNRTNRIEDIRHTHTSNPRGHRKNEDGAKRVSHKRESRQSVAEDFCANCD